MLINKALCHSAARRPSRISIVNSLHLPRTPLRHLPVWQTRPRTQVQDNLLQLRARTLHKCVRAQKKAATNANTGRSAAAPRPYTIHAFPSVPTAARNANPGHTTAAPSQNTQQGRLNSTGAIPDTNAQRTPISPPNALLTG